MRIYVKVTQASKINWMCVKTCSFLCVPVYKLVARAKNSYLIFVARAQNKL